MKFFVAIALIATVASAAIIKPTVVSGELAEIQEIIAAINSPSTNPATAAALEEMLLDALGVKPEPVAVGPAIVDTAPISVGPAIVDTSPISVGPAIVDFETVGEPISVGPAIVDFPMPDGGAVAEVPIIAPSPVVVGPVAEASANLPLVQIILNINQAPESASVVPSPVAAPEVVQPVQVVESAPVAPVQVVEAAPVAPVQVVEAAPVQVVEAAPVQVVEAAPVQVVDVAPVQVIETAPVAVEPVIIGTPVLPAPAVILPESLN